MRWRARTIVQRHGALRASRPQLKRDSLGAHPHGQWTMPVLADVLLWLVAELLIQLAGELLLAVGLESLSQSLGGREKAHPALAGLGCLVLGALTGLIVTLIYPTHSSPGLNVQYFAVVILPVGVGAVAYWLGSRAERAGRPRPALATFWGGGLFALAMSVVRFLFLRAGGA